jgi:hypothetical protein
MRGFVLPTALLAGLLILPLLGMGALGAVAATEHPVRVTTDSSAYCQQLSARLADAPRSAEEPARSLAEEGQRLCQTGHVRTGIAKLRRALRAAQPGG